MAVFDNSNLTINCDDARIKKIATTYGLSLIQSHDQNGGDFAKFQWMTDRLAKINAEMETMGCNVGAVLTGLAADGSDGAYANAVVTLTNLDGTLYYMVVADGGTPSHADIKAATGNEGSAPVPFTPTQLTDQPIPANNSLAPETTYVLAVTFESTGGSPSVPVYVDFTTFAA